MSNYYFLGTLLPELSLDRPPEMTFREFEQLLAENLSSKDFEKVKITLRYYDFMNLRAYWKKEPFDVLGNLDEAAMEEAIVTQSLLPLYPFVYDFLNKYDTDKKRLEHFSELLSHFFQYEVSSGHLEKGGLLETYFTMERERRLVLMALRAKKLGRDLIKEFQYENPDEELVAQLLAQKDTAQFVAPEKYEELARIYYKYEDDPLQLQKSMIEYRMQKIEEYLGLDLFSIERIIGYMLELILVEKWHHLDKQKGKEKVEAFLDNKPHFTS